MSIYSDELIIKIATELSYDVASVRDIWEKVLVNHPLQLFKAPPQVDFNHQSMKHYFYFIKNAVKYYQENSTLLEQQEQLNESQRLVLINTYIENYYVDWTKEKGDVSEDRSRFAALVLVDKNGKFLPEQLGYLECFSAGKIDQLNGLSALDVTRFFSQNSYDHEYNLFKDKRGSRIKSYPFIRSYYQILSLNEVVPALLLKKAQDSDTLLVIYILLPNGGWCRCDYLKNRNLVLDTGRYAIQDAQLKGLITKLSSFFKKEVNVKVSAEKANQSLKALIYSGFDILSRPETMLGMQESVVLAEVMSGFPRYDWQNVYITSLLPSTIFAAYFLFPGKGISFVQDKLNRQELTAQDLLLIHGESICRDLDKLAKHLYTIKNFLSNALFTQASIETFRKQVLIQQESLGSIKDWDESNLVPRDENHREQLLNQIKSDHDIFNSNTYTKSLNKALKNCLQKNFDKKSILTVLPPLDELRDRRDGFIFEELDIKSEDIETLRQAVINESIDDEMWQRLMTLLGNILQKHKKTPNQSVKDTMNGSAGALKYFMASVGDLIERSATNLIRRYEFMWDINLNASEDEKRVLCEERYYIWYCMAQLGLSGQIYLSNPDERILDRIGSINFINVLKASFSTAQKSLSCNITDLRLNDSERHACLAFFDHHPFLKTITFTKRASDVLETAIFKETKQDHYLFRMLLSYCVQKTLARNEWLDRNDHICISGQAASDHWRAAVKYAFTYLGEHSSLLSLNQNGSAVHEVFKTFIGRMGVSYVTACFQYLQNNQTVIQLMLGDKRPDFLIGTYQPVNNSCDQWVEQDRFDYYDQLKTFLFEHFEALPKNKTLFFPFRRLILPYSNLIDAKDYAHLFQQASQTYCDLEAIVLDTGLSLNIPYGLLILQTIDFLLQTDFEPTTLLSIPCLDDVLIERVSAEEYRQLRMLYRDINHRILTYCRTKHAQALLQQTRVIPTAQPIDIATLPFRRSQGKQYGLEYQHQMTVQQQQEQEIIEDHDDVLPSNLVTVSNINQFDKILNQASALKIALPLLELLFLEWVGLERGEKNEFAFHAMTERAFLMLLEHHFLFEGGVHCENLPQGFHRIENDKKQWVLDYQPLKPRKGILNDFTVRFHTRQQAEPLLGHYRDFLTDKNKPKQVTEGALQASLLFSCLASKEQNQRAFAVVDKIFLPNCAPEAQACARNHASYACAFIQLFEDFGAAGIEALESNLLLNFNPLNAWIDVLNAHDSLVAKMFQQQGYTASDLTRWGQVYQQYGMEGVSKLIHIFNDLKMFNPEIFDVFKTNIIDTSCNFCEFLDTKSGVQNVLQEILHCKQVSLWLAILKQHSAALSGLGAYDLVQLWKAFCLFQKELQLLNVTIDDAAIPKETNLLLWMSKVLEVLKALPAEQRQVHIAQLSVANLRHGGQYYSLLYKENPIESFARTLSYDTEEKGNDLPMISQALSDRIRLQKNRPDQLENLEKILALNSGFFTEDELRFRANLLVPDSQHLNYPVGLLSILLQKESEHGHLSESILFKLNERLFNHEKLSRLEQIQCLSLLFINDASWENALTLLDTIPSDHKSMYLNGLEKIQTAQALEDYLVCYQILFSANFHEQHPTLLQDWFNALNHPEKQANAIKLLKELSDKNPTQKGHLLVIIGRLYASPALMGAASSNESYRKCRKIIQKLELVDLEPISAICADYPSLTVGDFFKYLKHRKQINGSRQTLETELLPYLGTKQPRRDYGDELRQEDYDRISSEIFDNNPFLEKEKLRDVYQKFQDTRKSLVLHDKSLNELKQKLDDSIAIYSLAAKENALNHDYYQYTVLAILCEIMYRSTGKYPKLTQQLSMLIKLFSADKPHVFDMDTGEGKAILLHMFTAIDVLLSHKTVDIMHYKRNLVERDVAEFKTFYQLLGIKAGAVIAGKPRDLTLQVHNGTPSDLWLSEHLLTITTGEKLPRERSVKIDESDVLSASEKHIRHKLAIPCPHTVLEMAWFYEAINAFYDANQAIMFDDTGAIYAQVANGLLQYLVEQAKNDPIRLEIVKSYALTPEKQAGWLIAADDAAHLKENVHFILTQPKLSLVDNDVALQRYMIPIDSVTKEPLECMNFDGGVQQLKVQRLNQKTVLNGEVRVYMPELSVLLSSDVGEQILSVYNGNTEGFTATPSALSAQKNVLHIPTNYPSLREHQACQIAKSDEYIQMIADKIRNAFKEKRSILISCENNAQSERAHVI